MAPRKSPSANRGVSRCPLGLSECSQISKLTVHSEASPESRISDTHELHPLGKDVEALVDDVVDHRLELGHRTLADLILGEVVDVAQL